MAEAKYNNPEWIGQRFGRLTVIGSERRTQGRGWLWIVRCDCGTVKRVLPADVRKGATRSCGCYHDEVCTTRATKFKHSVYENKRLYGIYNGIKKRCYNKNEPRYRGYGARGIVMCDEWLNPVDGFDKFVDWSLSHGYADNLTIDRIDVNGNYSPDNCRWLTLSEQNGNKRDTIWIEYKGEMVRFQELCKRSVVSYDTTHDRVFKRGWDIERALTTPSVRGNTDKLRRLDG